MLRLTSLAIGAALAVGIVSGAYAQTAPPRPKREQPAPSRERVPERARTATVVIESDEACSIAIDGGTPTPLAASEGRTLQLEVGEHVLRAVSTENPQVVWRKAIEVAAGQRRAVVIELRPLIDQAAEAKRRAAEAADTEARRVPEKPALPALLITADVDAEITVNGGEPATVKAGESIRVRVEIGQNRVDAKAIGKDARWTTTVEVEKPAQILLQTELTKVLDAQAQAKAAEEQLRRLEGNWTISNQYSFPYEGCTVTSSTRSELSLRYVAGELIGEQTTTSTVPVGTGVPSKTLREVFGTSDCVSYAARTPRMPSQATKIILQAVGNTLRGTYKMTNPEPRDLQFEVTGDSDHMTFMMPGYAAPGETRPPAPRPLVWRRP